MKKMISVLLAIITAFSMTAALAAEDIKVVIDGNTLQMDVAPQIINDRTQVPLRAIFEALDAEVLWDGDLQKITGTKGSTKIVLFVGNDTAMIGDSETKLDSPPVIINSRTLVPVRFISEALGCKVDWNGESRMVTITSEKKEEIVVPDTPDPAVKPEGVSDEVWNAISKFDELCDKGIVDFFVSLYDPETGGFSKSPSSLRVPGFEAELEATATIMIGLPTMGLVARDYLSDPDVPEGFYDKLIDYFLSRQSEEDGYWYDPLYGNYMIETKRERSSSKTITMLENLKVKPLYPTYMDRISAKTVAAADGEIEYSYLAASENEAKSNLPEYFSSEKAYLDWMENKNWTTDTYLTGNQITNSIPIAMELGYGEAAGKFLLDKMNPTTGLWGIDEVTGDTTNGGLKLTHALVQLGVKFPYVEAAMKTIIQFIKDNENPEHVCEIWNPLILIGYIRRTHDNKFEPEIQEMLDKNVVEILELTAAHLNKHRTPDGGYRYYPYIPGTESGGVIYATGFDEQGNIEGSQDPTCTASYLMRGTVYSVAGVPPRPGWSQYKKYFWSEIEKKMNAPLQKRYEDCKVYEEDFEDVEETSDLYDSWGFVIQGDKETNHAVTKDPTDRDNKLLKVTNGPTVNTQGASDYFRTNFKIPESEKYTAEFKFMVDSESKNPLYVFDIGQRCASIYLVKNQTVGAMGGGMALAWAVKSDVGKSNNGTLITGLEKDTWYTLKVEYEPRGMEDTVTRYYLDDELLCETNLFYNGGFSDRHPSATMRSLTVRAYGRASEGTIYMDDISVYGTDAH